MTHFHSARRRSLMAAAALSPWASVSFAQTWPDKPLRMIVPIHRAATPISLAGSMLKSSPSVSSNPWWSIIGVGQQE